MGIVPITLNFEGDFVLQLVAVDSENTMDEAAAAAAVHSAGGASGRVRNIMRVRRQGAEQLFRRAR